MAVIHPAAQPAEELFRDCRMSRVRSSGPGGQHRNKVATGVILTHIPTGIKGQALESREPERNRRTALFRLRMKLALEVRTPGFTPIGYQPSPTFQSRITRTGQLRLNPAHEDAPAVLAEMLDLLEAMRWDVRKTSLLTGLSQSQVVKALHTLEPAALIMVNEHRSARGLRKLK